MEINGLPLHPLAVHGAVVLAPVACLVALAYLVPAWRDRLRWPLLATALLALGAVVVAVLSGHSFRDANAFFNDPSVPVTAQIDTHETRGMTLLYWSIGFTVLAVATTALHAKRGALRWVLSGILGVVALVVLVLTVLTGDAGSRAVWEGFAG